MKPKCTAANKYVDRRKGMKMQSTQDHTNLPNLFYKGNFKKRTARNKTGHRGISMEASWCIHLVYLHIFINISLFPLECASAVHTVVEKRQMNL